MEIERHFGRFGEIQPAATAPRYVAPPQPEALLSRTAAPLAGGIASSVRREWPWLPAGLVISAAMVGLAILVSTGRARWIACGLAIAIVLVMLLAALLAEQQPALT